MGLAEPRKRIKLSHDPRNLQWSESSDSFGARIMQSSGWTPGTALGASSIPVPAHEATAAKVRIAVKDDTLGLGASLKSRDLQHQRTGLDAFQGLLGRLNAKDEAALKKVEEKIENKKLAMFAQGRWGGMVFVPGGLLVQEDPKSHVPKSLEEKEDKGSAGDQTNEEDPESIVEHTKSHSKRKSGETPEERAKRKAEKKLRKEERQARREAKRTKKLLRIDDMSVSTSATSDITDTDTGASTPVQLPEINVTTVSQERLRNGRHILRGRNIQAKRMAFSDSKGLDQIFMRQQQAQEA